MQILLGTVKKLACGTCIRIRPLLQNVNIMKEITFVPVTAQGKVNVLK